jgi:hypothetical protein
MFDPQVSPCSMFFNFDAWNTSPQASFMDHSNTASVASSSRANNCKPICSLDPASKRNFSKRHAPGDLDDIQSKCSKADGTPYFVTHCPYLTSQQTRRFQRPGATSPLLQNQLLVRLWSLFDILRFGARLSPMWDMLTTSTCFRISIMEWRITWHRSTHLTLFSPPHLEAQLLRSLQTYLLRLVSTPVPYHALVSDISTFSNLPRIGCHSSS